MSKADDLFLALLDSEASREALVVGDLNGEVRLSLDTEVYSLTTVLTFEEGARLADKLEQQAKQEGFRDEMEPVLTKIRDACYEAGTP